MRLKRCIPKSLNLPRVYSDDAKVDNDGRIRVDDWEMRADVQAAVEESWNKISNENFTDLADFKGYQDDFLKLFGFGMDGVDYDADTDPETAPLSLG